MENKNSFETCDFCEAPAYKTNGKGDSICETRAYTGQCIPDKGRSFTMPAKAENIQGRNEACNCRSGKKFKNCCIKNKK